MYQDWAKNTNLSPDDPIIPLTLPFSHTWGRRPPGQQEQEQAQEKEKEHEKEQEKEQEK